MALTQVRPSMAAVTRTVERKQEHHAEFLEHVENFLARLQSSWPNTENCVWDEQVDTVAYARQVLKLTREQVREIYYRLRERHTFRPSVAEVRAAVDELVAQTNPTAGLTGAEIAARTVVAMPKGLPSAANGPGRQKARREAERRRWMLGQESAPVADVASPSSPETLEASLVGRLAVAFVEGRDVRGVVWSQEGDRVQIKLASGERVWLDSIRVRVEEPKEYSASNTLGQGAK